MEILIKYSIEKKEWCLYFNACLVASFEKYDDMLLFLATNWRLNWQK